MLYHCPFSIAFWRDFEAYWLMVRDEQIHLTLEDIIVGVITRTCPLLNYFLLIAKTYLWDCRRNRTFPNIVGFKAKIEFKYETEAYIARKGNKIKFYNRNGRIVLCNFIFTLLLFYVYRIFILFFSHFNDYFLANNPR